MQADDESPRRATDPSAAEAAALVATTSAAACQSAAAGLPRAAASCSGRARPQEEAGVQLEAAKPALRFGQVPEADKDANGGRGTGGAAATFGGPTARRRAHETQVGGQKHEPQAEQQRLANPIKSGPGSGGDQGGRQGPAGSHQAQPSAAGSQVSAQREAAPEAGGATQVAPPQSPKSAGGGQQHDKSMAQARYLFSTLTSNAGALLAAALSGQQQPAAAAAAQEKAEAKTTAPSQQQPGATSASAQGASESGTREAKGGQSSSSSSSQPPRQPSGPVATSPSRPARKQAQFVAAELRAKLAIATGATTSTSTSTSPTGPALRLGPESWPTRPTSAGAEPAKRQQASSEAQAKPSSARGPLCARGSSSGPSSSSSASECDGDGDGDGDGPLDRPRPLAPGRGRRRRRSGGSKSHSTSDSQDEEEEQLSESNDRVGVWGAPAIVESACEQRRRSSQSSRSVSQEVASAAHNAPPIGQSNSGAGKQLRPQPNSMDPAMHALWAQGADLDTGNGNFIMATRRRRSVHAIHQVQLHQQQIGRAHV